MSVSSQDDFRDSFFEECEELLEAMQDGFDQLADNLNDTETMHAIFRAVHSIKGGAGAFGLNELVAFSHQFETALDKVRSGSVDADDDLVLLFRQCGDHLSDVVSAARDDSGVQEEVTEQLLGRLNESIGENLGEQEEEPDFEPVTLDFGFGDADDDTDDDSESSGEASLPEFKVSFTAHQSMFEAANEPYLLFRSAERLGEVSVVANIENVPALENLDPADPQIEWELTLVGDVQEDDVHEVFEFVDDNCKIEVTCVSGGADLAALPDLEEAELPEVSNLPDLSSFSEREPEPPAAEDEGETEAAGNEPSSEPEPKQPKAAAPKAAEAKKPAGTIRVDLEKVDKLINLVGELVIKEAMLSQSISEFNPPSESDVSVGLDSLKQLAGEIQEGVMAIRAQPVKPMFQRMSRIVRESASATGKRVKFVTKGEYTEVDKTVIERLVDPLTHMIRNAIDHGLESTEDRVEAGKPDQGTVTLAAAHRSGRVIIDISDDGGGINREKVKSIAASKGLVDPNADLTPVEIDNLLFLPGFSSKEEVSELSGRGVGLDVARSEIQGLGGRVFISSTPEKGTTFSISLPLTLAVLEGMVIKVADQTMVVPISTIQETLRPNEDDVHKIGADGKILKSRNSVVPIIDIGEFFGFRNTCDSSEAGVFLLIESEDKQKYALIVDEIQDQRQVVIKSLETNYQRISGVSAATILGDGRIALIIDPDTIIKDCNI